MFKKFSRSREESKKPGHTTPVIQTSVSDPITVLRQTAQTLDELETRLKTLIRTADQATKIKEIQAIKTSANKISTDLDKIEKQVSGSTADVKKYLDGRIYYLLSKSWDLSVRFIETNIRLDLESYLKPYLTETVDSNQYHANESRFSQGDAGEKAERYQIRADNCGFDPRTLTSTAMTYVSNQLDNVMKPH